MVNNAVIFNYLYAIIIALSIIAIIDVLFKFKRPIRLKLLLLAILINIGMLGFGKLYIYYNGYNRLLSELPIILLAVFGINFFYQLYRNKLSLYVILYCIFLLLYTISVPIYFNFKYGLDFLNENFYTNPITSKIIITIRVLGVVSFLILAIFLLYKIIIEYKFDNLYYASLRRWCVVIIFTLIVAIFPNIFFYIFPSLSDLKVISNIFLCIFLAILIIYRPKFLNSMPNEISSFKLFNSNNVVNNISFEQFTFSFFSQLFFLKEHASIQELSVALNVTKEELQDFIKDKYNMSFIDMINKHRVLYFIELIKLPENIDYTIEALSKKSGFSSRQNMHKSFKKYHGGNPSDLINIMHL
jgi:AraC-like DNA-binding protein